MITLHHQSLLVCFADGHIEPLNLHDLVEHLARDFPRERADLPPWIVEGAVESLIRHFRENAKRNSVSLGEFIKTANALLVSFIHETLDDRGNERQLDLFATAQCCGSGFELEFFMAIRRFLGQRDHRAKSSSGLPASAASEGGASVQPDDFHQKNVSALRFTSLRRCAKFLAGRRRWGKRCSQVRDEIVAVIRQEAARNRGRDLAVTVLS